MSTISSISKSIKNKAGNTAFRTLLLLSCRLTPKRIDRWSGAIAWLAYRMSKRYRGVATRNMTMALGDQYPPEKITQMVKDVFRHFCRGALEFFYLANADQQRIESMIDLTGLEHLDGALARGKGVVLITAHFGNWELLARRACLLGYKVTVIARDSDDPGMTGIANKIREGAGYKVLGRDRSVRGAIDCLRKNEILGILPDQNVASGGVLVDFFGMPATTATGPAAFVLRTDAAVIPAFAHRGADGKYHGVLYPALEFTPTGDREKDEHALTAAITQSIEKVVREHPSQWLWLHDRWKTAREMEGRADG